MLIIISTIVIIYYILPILDLIRLIYLYVRYKISLFDIITIRDIFNMYLGTITLVILTLIPYINIIMLKEFFPLHLKPLWHNPITPLLNSILNYKIYVRSK